jgi:hypothetical protein
LQFSAHCFVGPPATKQFSRRRNHFLLLAQTSGNTDRLLDGHETAGQRRQFGTGDNQMRTISFILAFAFVLGGASLAGSSDTGLPGVGTFAYSGIPAASTVPAIVVAAR